MNVSALVQETRPPAVHRPGVLVADSQELVVEAFARLLEPEFRVLGRVTDGGELVEQALRLRPELVLTDLSLRRLGGLEATRLLRRDWPEARIVLLTMQDDEMLAGEAFEAGAVGYVLRSIGGRELLRALRAVLRGERWLSPALAGGDPDALPDPPPSRGAIRRLSQRRREVVRLLAEGHSMKQAAAALGLSTRTIAFHKYGAMKALDVTSSAQLVRVAVEGRLLSSVGN